MVLFLYTNPLLSLIFSLIAFLCETIFFGMLIIGWYFGARRLDFKFHHWMIYTSVPLHIVIVVIWMFPRFLYGLTFITVQPITVISMLFHVIAGIIGLVIAIGLLIVFIVNRDLNISILKKTRPFMFATLILWVILFVGGTFLATILNLLNLILFFQQLSI